jgi:hypothetical protein
MSYYPDYDYCSNVSNSDDDDMSFTSNRQKVNKFMAETEKDDLRFSVQRWVSVLGKPKKLITFLFGSGSQGTTIRNAMTGQKYYGHRVGSRNEDLYFKAMHCTGEFGGRSPVVLFYDSAEQYERHMTTVYDDPCQLQTSVKEKFARKQNRASLR